MWFLFAITLHGQVRISVPFGLFYGDGIEGTSFQPIININCIANYNRYYAIDFDEKHYLITELGIGAIGTKQSYEDQTFNAKIFSLKAGFYYRYDILDPQFTPFVITGFNLNALFANHPDLAIRAGEETTVEEFSHRVLFPEYVIGAGLSLGNFSFDIRDHIGLTSVDKDKSVKSNAVSIGVAMHLRDLIY